MKTIVKDAGMAHMGMGFGSGSDKAVDAAKQAIESRCWKQSIDGATGVLINSWGGTADIIRDRKIAEIVRQEAHPDANIIFGACIDPNLDDEIKVTVDIATGFNTAKQPGPIKIDSETETRPVGIRGLLFWMIQTNKMKRR